MKNYIIYHASAGSGKTYTIVLEYLKLLLKNPKKKIFKNILAVTFTNKASYEMKYRILETLLQLSNQNCFTSKYYNELIQYLNCSYQNIQKKAKIVLTSLLHNYSYFSVSTIDKFNLHIIQSFFKELNITNNIIINLNCDLYIEESVEKLINTINYNNNCIYRKELNNFILKQENNINNYKIKNIKFNLINNFKEYINEKNYFFIQFIFNKSNKDFIKLKNLIRYKIKSTYKKMIKILSNSLNLIQINKLSYKDFNGGKKNSIMIFFERAKKNLELNNYNKIINQSYQNLYNQISNNNILNKKLKYKNKLDNINLKLIINFKNYCLLLENYIINLKIFKQIINLKLIYKLKKILNSILFEKQIITISHTNSMIYENINNDTSEYIYEKIGLYYKYFFFDEAQDTSTLQWNNFLPLINNNFNKKNFFIFLVGDIKQSIYRFRTNKFNFFINEITKNDKNIKNKIIKNLSYNYRSNQNIVYFNNKLFIFLSNLIKNIYYKNIYFNSSQIPKGNKGGRVQISYIPDDDYENLVHNHILNIILQYQKNNVPLDHIVILFRNNKFMKKCANFLLNKKISIYTDDILFLNKISSINILFNVIKWINDPHNENILFEMLISLEKEKKHKKLEDFSLFFSSIKLLNIEEIQNKINIRYNINLNIINNLYINIFELFENLIISLKFSKHYQLYLLTILNEIYNIEYFNSISIDEFIIFFEKHYKNIKYFIPNKNNSVQLMTIHKSKGLEFPIVIYPNFKSINLNNEKIWIKVNVNEYNNFKYFYLHFNQNEKSKLQKIQDQISKHEFLNDIDQINLHYVALTRAISDLFIIFPMKNNKSKIELGNHIANIFNLNIQENINNNIFELFNYDKYKYNNIKEKKNNFLIFNWNSNSWKKHNSLINENEKLISNFMNPKKYGILIHKLLKKIYIANDLKKIYNKKIIEGIISHTIKDKLFNILNNIIFHPQLYTYYSSVNDKIYNEKEFIYKSIVYRPDRLVERNKNFSIIDYKIGYFNIKYIDQLKNYAKILNKLNYKVKDKILVLVNKNIEILFL